MNHLSDYKPRKKQPRFVKGQTYLTILLVTLIFAIAIVICWFVGFHERTLASLERSMVVNIYTAPEREVPVFEDNRAAKLYRYLESKNSPLAEHAELIVDVADANAIDWTLIAAIAGKESSFGRVIKPGSHNAWGVMQWDREGNRSIRDFDSWEEAIQFEGALLGKHYREEMYSAIQAKYCPSFECSDTWTENVREFSEGMQDL